MSSNSNDISYHHNNKVEGEVVDSRPIWCVCQCELPKKKNLYGGVPLVITVNDSAYKETNHM